MLAETCSATLQGINALPVTVEANGGEKGEPRCVLVGLPDTAVKESLDRVLSGLANTGYSSPRTRVTINLAPAELPKHGAGLDLAMAIGILRATGALEGDAARNTSSLRASDVNRNLDDVKIFVETLRYYTSIQKSFDNFG